MVFFGWLGVFVFCWCCGGWFGVGVCWGVVLWCFLVVVGVGCGVLGVFGLVLGWSVS